MTREIKFRIWDKENKEMIYTPYLGVGSGASVISIGLDGHITLHNMFGLPDGEDTTKLHDDRFILMEYTGLKDMSGNKVFESDRLLHKDGFEGVVTYEPQGACWIVKSDKYLNLSESGMTGGEDGIWLDSWKIIGSIHDKELKE